MANPVKAAKGLSRLKNLKNIKALQKVKNLKFSSSLKGGALGGLATFFGFEWLTNGGLVDSVGGTLGVSDTIASIILILVCVGIVGGLIYYVFFRKKDNAPIPRTSGGSRTNARK